jgi:hypothetical protein
MNNDTPRMTEAWARSSRTADGFYSSTTPISVYARSCYVEGCKLERELTAVTAQRDEAREYADKLAEGLPDGMLPKDVEVLREANLGLATNIAAVTEQRNRLAEALRVATAYPLSDSWYKQAIDALATLKPCD